MGARCTRARVIVLYRYPRKRKEAPIIEGGRDAAQLT